MKDQHLTFDLRDGCAVAELAALPARPMPLPRHAPPPLPASVQTAVTAEHAGATGILSLSIAAVDPDCSGLIAGNAPDDRFLYEDDCIQIGIQTGAGACATLLVNPAGNCNASPGARDWRVAVRRDDRGWGAAIDIAVAPGTVCLGLSVHRFFRGIRGRIYGLTEAVPHPLAGSAFAVLVVAGSGDAATLAGTYRDAVRAAADDDLSRRLSACRQRLRPAGAAISVARACELARARGRSEVIASERFLCWNEAYFQLALIDLWLLTGSSEWLRLAVARIDRVWQLRGATRGAPDRMWRRPLPTWYNETESGTACTLVSGVILNPIARLLRLVHETAELAAFETVVDAWLPSCTEIIALHDREWIEMADGCGMHCEPYPKGPRGVYPYGGSRINPLNREFWLSMPMLNLARVTGNAEHLRKVTMNAQFFRNTCDVSEGRWSWEYEAAAYPAAGEDLAHAQSQWQFAELCCREGIVFSEADLQGIAAMFSEVVFQHGDVPCGTLRGHDPQLHLAVGVWSSICRFRPHLLPRIRAVLESVMAERGAAFSDGWSLRNLTALLLTERDLEQSR